MSRKITLTLGEEIVLQKELSNILKEKLSLSIKMDIQKLLTKVNSVVKDYNEQRLEFFKIHGKEKNGNYFLPDDVDTKVTKELQDTLDKKEHLTVDLKFDTFEDLVSEYPYYVFFKLFQDSTEPITKDMKKLESNK